MFLFLELSFSILNYFEQRQILLIKAILRILSQLNFLFIWFVDECKFLVLLFLYTVYRVSHFLFMCHAHIVYHIVESLVIHGQISPTWIGLLQFFFKSLHFPFVFESDCFYVFLSLFLEFLKLCIVMSSRVFKCLAALLKLALQADDLPTVKLLQPYDFWLESFIFQLQILIVVDNRVILELNLRNLDLLPSILVFYLYELVLKL